MRELHRHIDELQGRSPPLPDWVKPTVLERSEGARPRAHLARWLKVEPEGEAAQALHRFLTEPEGERWGWAEGGAAAHDHLTDQRLGQNTAKKRKLSWGSWMLGGAERFAALARAVQTGEMPEAGLAEFGAKVLGGRPDPFGSSAGPPRCGRAVGNRSWALHSRRTRQALT